MEQMGMNITVIKAGCSNMFKSPVFRAALAGVSGTTIELYDTDGSVGAAKGAGLGASVYKSAGEAFSTLKKIKTVEPSVSDIPAYQDAYGRWKELLNQKLYNNINI